MTRPTSATGNPDNATYRAGQLNQPTTTNKGSKRGLIPAARRVRVLIATLVRLRVDVVGMQEVGNITRTVFRAHPGWVYLPGGVNSMMPRNRKGSGLAFKRGAVKVLHRRAIRVPYPQAWRRRLKQPRILTADPNTDQRCLLVVAHPPRRGEEAAQRRVLAGVAAACQAATDQAIAVVVLADTNNLALAREILGAAGMRLATDPSGCAIFVNRYVQVTGRGRDLSVAGVITDHKDGMPYADLQLVAGTNTTATRIPT